MRAGRITDVERARGGAIGFDRECTVAFVRQLFLFFFFFARFDFFQLFFTLFLFFSSRRLRGDGDVFSVPRALCPSWSSPTTSLEATGAARLQPSDPRLHAHVG